MSDHRQRRSRVQPRRRPSCSTTTVRPPARSRRRPRSPTRCRCSTASPVTAICFPAAPPIWLRPLPADVMLNGMVTQAGLTAQLINERRQADQGVGNMAHLTVSSPPLTTTVTSLAEDGSSFGLKLGAITSSLTGATVTQPAGVPPAADRRSRCRQSERRRQDHLQLRSARWHHRADRADCDHDRTRRPPARS